MLPKPLPPESGLPRTTVLLNSSSLKVSNCRRRYNYVVAEGLQNRESAEALTFGKAVHRYAEMRHKGADHGPALIGAFALYTGPNTGLLSTACMNMPARDIIPYVDPAGKVHSEIYFQVYWQSIVAGDRQFDIFVCGTFDVVTMFADGAVQLVDYKTTRKYKTADVFADYAVSVQMQFYLWAAWRFGFDIFDLTIANQTTRGNVFLRICAVLLTATPPAWRMGSPITKSIAELQQFEVYLNAYLRDQIIPAWLDPAPTGMLNDTCNRGDRPGAICDFAGACYAENTTAKNQALEAFTKKPYDPAKF
jgi:hypothetical protein